MLRGKRAVLPKGASQKIPIFGDIKAFQADEFAGSDVVTAGFPCQPFSIAGRRKGVADERNIWPDVLRCIRDIRPKIAFLENVPALLVGPYFGEILRDLAEVGYDAEWDVVSAFDVGAPHLRKRLWIVAYAQSGENGKRKRGDLAETTRGRKSGDPALGTGGEIDAVRHAERRGRGGKPRRRTGTEFEDGHLRVEKEQLSDPISQRPQGVGKTGAKTRTADRPGDGCHSDWWAVEPDVGRVAYGVPDRVDRLKALGNAVVPQVVEMIGLKIKAFLTASEARIDVEAP